MSTVTYNRSDVIKEAWKRGRLSYKLSPEQKDLYDLFYQTTHKTITFLLSRRFGKTFFLCLVGAEQCLRKRYSIIKFVAPTKIQIDKIVRPIMRTLFDDCPEDLKPKFDKKEYIYYFPNGSEFQLAGNEGGHIDSLRGGDSDLFFVDEAQSCSNLEYAIKDVLFPTTLITKGRGILAGTPPREPDHEFLNYIEDCELKHSLIKRTIDDITRITQEEKDALIAELGGPTSESTRRELYCEIIRDPSVTVIPEFTPQLEKEIIKEVPRSPFFDAYVGMDVGVKDLTALVFGYYDFRSKKVFIEDELIVDFKLPGNNFKTLAQDILKKEKELWTNQLTNELIAPYLRVSDIDYHAMREISFHSDGRLNFKAADKYDNDAAINNLRLLLNSGKIIIHPRCQTLIRHLKNVKWNKSRKDFARSPDDSHYDLVSALKYFVRHVNWEHNAYPSTFDVTFSAPYYQRPEKFIQPNQVEVWQKIFNVKPKRRF